MVPAPFPEVGRELWCQVTRSAHAQVRVRDIAVVHKAHDGGAQRESCHGRKRVASTAAAPGPPGSAAWVIKPNDGEVGARDDEHRDVF